MIVTETRPVCEIVPFPPLQRQAVDWLELNRRRHTMHGLIEVDVTETRRAIRAYRARCGVPLSLTAFIIYCLARTVDQDRTMQAYRLGRRRLVLFADVDVGSMVEREVDGVKIPVPHVIRSANTKCPEEIEREMRSARTEAPEAVSTGSLPAWLRPLLVRGLSAWLLVPAPLRRLIWTLALHNPYRRKRLMGTVGVTAVSMFGHGTGWAVAPMGHPLTVAIGGLVRKPGFVDGQSEPREYLCLTLTLDHDVIEGAPAARFAKRLTDLIEDSTGLGDGSCFAGAIRQ
jgi:pyruvate/2-oxoglutarate dehydrogenase complex dihydrolipoamide acyltransferase (E2) component